MEASSFDYAILVQWGTRLPALLVYFVGAVVALTLGQRFRIAAALTLGAMVLLGVLTLGTPFVMLSLPRWQSEHGWTVAQLGIVGSVIGLILSVGQALGVGLLLAAVFFRRAAPVTNLPAGLPPPLPHL